MVLRSIWLIFVLESWLQCTRSGRSLPLNCRPILVLEPQLKCVRTCTSGTAKTLIIEMSDYGKYSGNHTSFQNLSTEKDKVGCPRQFSFDYFETTKAFQGERNINTDMHLRDSQLAREYFQTLNLTTDQAIPHPQSESNSANCVNLDSYSHPLFPSQNVIQLTDTPAPTLLPPWSGHMSY